MESSIIHMKTKLILFIYITIFTHEFIILPPFVRFHCEMLFLTYAYFTLND